MRLGFFVFRVALYDVKGWGFRVSFFLFGFGIWIVFFFEYLCIGFFGLGVCVVVLFGF